ncbi:thiamine pyrophosphate-binding protein [Tepidiforma sp.]|uniref:thiamine pyrophosphate-binding protein n=1 Tax=Tepidiforma sp. TaxID=2682230 RepID=UPI0026341995|nr:thiamine pyrophosphate-binding protein [Tepidiforma sp.]MCX7618520.1 thiamine pyrophosphate-binding protein [Tepidiforma sp.]
MGTMIDGGEIIARMIKQEGVSHIFTLSGGHIQNIYEGCLNNGIGIVDTRHEQSAGHAADGYSRITFKPGVAVVTAGPGVTDVVTAVANAYQASSPMVVIGGRSPLRQYDMGSLQDIELLDVMKPITKWSQAVYETRRLPYYMAMAFREAMTGRYGPAFLQVPSDVLFGRVDEDSLEWPKNYRVTGEIMGDPALIKQAAQLIRDAEKPMVMAGSGVFWHRAHRELAEFARAADVPVYTNAMGRGTLRQDNPNFFSLSRKPAFAQADVIVILGTPIDFRLKYGRPPAWNPAAKVIQIDIDPRDIGRNRDFTIGIEANIRQALLQLTSEIGKAEHREWMTYLRGLENQADEQRSFFMNSDAVPIHPLRLCKEIAEFVDDDTIVVGDGGDIVALAASVLPINNPGQWMDPGPFGTLGVGTGFCMAAAVAAPGKKVLMVNGDGTFGLNGFDFDTFVRFKMPIVSVVGNDRCWHQIYVGQKAQYGEGRTPATVLGDNARYDKVVEGLGGHGEFVEHPEQIKAAIERAFASGKPACVNVIMDPEPAGVKGGYEFK